MRSFFSAFLLLMAISGKAQEAADTLPCHKISGRQWLIGGFTLAGYGGSFVLLNEAWYKNYLRTAFHSYNDSGEWLQMDKGGHVWTAYQTSRLTTAMWQWAGTEAKKAVWLGTGSSLLYLLSIEYLDGRSQKWGWSWADVVANFTGAGLFAAQKLRWNEEKFQVKFSSRFIHYQPALKARADELYGSSFQGRLLKDYNAQTYWLGMNLKSVFPESRLPSWLNLSIGYGADGMFGGYENIAYDKNGNVVFERKDIKRLRQWYLAPDVDLTKIKTQSRVLKTLLFTLNVLKFPAPAIEYSGGRVKLHVIYF